MSIVVYSEVETPIIPAGDLAGPVRDALGGSLRSMRYVTPDFAGLYQDYAGTTPVTAVGQPVGLMMDRRFSLSRGAELFTGFTTLGSGWQDLGGGRYARSVLASQSDAVGTGTIAQNNGAFYEVSIAVSALTGSVFTYTLSSNPRLLSAGVNTFVISANSNLLIVRASAGASVTVESISIREVPGKHASQATTTARPTLRSGPLRIDYDGVDDYLRTVFPDLGDDVTIARSIPGVGAQYLTGQTIAAGNWDDNVDSCATLVIDRALTGPETALVTAFLNQQAGV